MLVAAIVQDKYRYRADPDHVPGVGPYKVLVVLSDSMKSVFAAGDMIIIDASKSGGYEINDIITFRQGPNMFLSHRITGLEERSGQQHYYTRGDANNTGDSETVRQEEILGEYLFKLPFGGYLVNFVHTTLGFVLLIVIPLLVAIGYEFRKNLLDLKGPWKRLDYKK